MIESVVINLESLIQTEISHKEKNKNLTLKYIYMESRKNDTDKSSREWTVETAGEGKGRMN